ncbi:ATP-dependent RNA helicase DDX10/DBP4 [Fistulifera solaris]|jgi:ATP-dependent RNA helicase DDX10/DBP4|uniref:ATP-dependent RNA helicase n=1 Tax=Fistulifera solaris TaxID=1519565 RepID=A0A1Z5JXD5_FISSO|nr:ATP-dependent RNA helicase DDX10/DBP4 [Fistulifera solaris]|eukprot:GAX18700.1 ATP-dependent RNA helicase DDX10/DBP4 [Fistulifera solaris]
MAKKKTGNYSKRKAESKQQLEEEIASLSKRVVEEAPACGYAPPLNQTMAFRALPISEKTLQGLEACKTPYTTMTAIQNACIPHALAGRDILGAARTGSGKTLAFVVPVLECLFRHRFTPADGPGAAILSPTRELAVQIFQVLKAAGKFHTFSVGLLIGGKKDFHEEQQHVATTNIFIATPGRLLQHLEQTPYFEMSELKILVLDEADRILDMGFRDQLVRILSYLPDGPRQTLLFSATQTTDVSDLATLSLRKPEYLGVHDKEKTSTPDSLQQSYVVVPLEHKLNAIYSFIKTHLRCKTIIFMASCAQVRHAWELFCSLQPGVPVMAIHGKLVQHKRTQIYFDFLQRPRAVLFATDIAARGLDFPNVDWVVQADAPEDRNMYIHRAGRTARYRNGGKSLLILTPKEEEKGFIEMLQAKNSAPVPIKKVSINPTKTVVVTQRAASLVAANVDLQRLAKKAYQSYVSCIHLMPSKEVFSVQDLNLDSFSESLGLSSTPDLKFLKDKTQDREERREKKNVNRKLQRLKEQIKAEKLAKRLAKEGKTAPETERGVDSDSEESGDELLVSKKEQNWTDPEKLNDQSISVKLSEVNQERKPKRIRIDGTNAPNKHFKFNESGEAEDIKGLISVAPEESIQKSKEDLETAATEYMRKIRERVVSNFEKDKAEEKERIRNKHKKRKLKEKAEKGDLVAENGMATLATLDDDASVESDDSETKLARAMSNTDAQPSSDSSDDEGDFRAQEDFALSIIRGSA